MSDNTRILVVAATARELAPADGWLTLQCGVGPVEAAAATATAIALHTPAAILHVGIAGARRRSTLAPPALVIGRDASFCDLSAESVWAPRFVETPPWLVAALQTAFPGATVLPIGTSARVGGTSDSDGIDVEAMEGFGVLRAAQLANVPAIEVRAISNEIEEEDRAMWRFDDAFAAITDATPQLVDAIREALNVHARASDVHA